MTTLPGVEIFAPELEDGIIEQVQALASMPFINPHVALMPDAHCGIGSSIGTVFGTVGAVIPAAVGVDLGCGMIGALTTLTASDLSRDDLIALRGRIEETVPLSPGNYNSDGQTDSAQARIAELEAKAEDVDLTHSPHWRAQLGSLGGGNHFIELCLDEDDRVWMLLHTGSRGVGNKIAQKHIRIAQKLNAMWHIQLPHKDLAYLVEGTDEFGDYLREMAWAQRFAWLNREEIMDRFSAALADVTGQPVTEVERINCHHNYTAKEEHYGRSVWLTRKGAVRADEGVMALIPGSMGTASYVVEGLGYPPALRSAPHGAGRRMSRTAARKAFTAADLAERMGAIVHRPGEEFVDEIPDAYKDIDEVMAASAKLVRVRHKLHQILNVKGT